MSSPLLQLSHEQSLKNGDLDFFFSVLDLTESLLDHFGVGALPVLENVAFQDTDLNVSSLLSLLIRVVLRKSDSTEVNL